MLQHDVRLRADEAPGILVPFLPIEFREPEAFGDAWLWMATLLRDGLEDGRHEVAFRYGGVLTEAHVPPTDIRMDARRPEVAARIVAWAFAGEKCSHPEADRVFFSCPGEARWDCMRCNTQLPGTGYTRPPHDLTPFLPTTLPGGRIASAEHSAAMLVASVRGIVAGVGPVAGVLGGWRRNARAVFGRPPHDFRLLLGQPENPPVRVIDGLGWFFTPHHGPETGAEGRACADSAALAHRFALLDADTLTLPEAPYLTSSTPSHTSES
jgi:hypothetical protein